MEIDKEVADNYRQLREERGWTWEQLAANVPTDRRLAAWMREQSEPAASPKRRRSAEHVEA